MSCSYLIGKEESKMKVKVVCPHAFAVQLSLPFSFYFLFCFYCKQTLFAFVQQSQVRRGALVRNLKISKV